MKVSKIILYAIAATLFIIMTSFKPEDINPNLQGGESQMHLPMVND